ncbi:similar to Saccharomyces cerevisiae YGR209C TRX2 Cytoplasmic thioredoxin isoenzyme of the thioredoxin system which protects cells against oxidative and reductive stress [Maudiozyma barnettii]|uniref:Thioredoxin n=1 Tax=Maudiozyma barnettii TaxID=61262 RepID=A0A8H2VIW3_9SACH|nr:thioredoxin TRX2 [Kazachstania barnettii]CAB4256459.1 similar to Saccharomyces cerevisiae YGR209C TRX2 Cytoplasmic thioredoxin isoenzyme of the thioredoxin system which protects cells against oxidative and reductive stress [Kazachstania barnettii]CAD1785068.1 similar to Saccharomyces cerevisiae YGR209C TRX2 Cytoplasmic thioredoxin isoenzyme of the thioredoxin system which protects cells against oxidative and reductive stress [Kazachstania barnettii]
MAVIQINSADEFKTALTDAGSKLVVVDFYATWCGPCKMIAPMVEKFSEQYNDATFLKLDVDAIPALAQEYEISAMPTLVFIKNGKEVTKVVGANLAAIKQNIVSNI